MIPTARGVLLTAATLSVAAVLQEAEATPEGARGAMVVLTLPDNVGQGTWAPSGAA